MKAVLFLVVLFLPCNSNAIWRRAETSSVPIERLLTNLTRRLQAATNDIEVLHDIARLHSLAYAAAKTNYIVEVMTNSRPLFGDGPGFNFSPPAEVIHSTNASENAVAKVHLYEAIRYYKSLGTIVTNSPVPLLGLGWCYAQAGDKTNAVSALRRAVKLAWSQERRQEALWESITAEAIGYLLPLLDAEKDRKEIAELRELQMNSLEKTGRMFTPLVIPLKPNVALNDLVNANASVAFDLDGSGLPNRKWQWITTNAAWIVHLPRGGTVTSALQMFGNVTFWMFWENGYHALASLDDNGDGLISGEELRGIKLWQDRNCDGQCADDEILELGQVGVTALDTHYANENGTMTSREGARFKDGSTRATYDVVLRPVGEPNPKR